MLFITLDSCRFDTFLSAHAPNMKAIGPMYRAMAPGNFTYSSHAAMFMGFTPGVAECAEAYVNPKFAKILRMEGAGLIGKTSEFIRLQGANLVDGFKRKGYRTLGTGGVGWFNPETDTGKVLTRDFDDFFYPGNLWSVDRQITWIYEVLSSTASETPVFVFLNIAETHVPYYYDGAEWDPRWNPCVPFANDNNAEECRRRQLACLEHVDTRLESLLRVFDESTVIICADHGDCWGEDGLWEHGFHHEKVLEVPFLFRLGRMG